jgi:hypothetical protein
MDPAVSQTFGPMVFTGSGPLTKESFQDAGIGVAEFCSLDAFLCVREQRLKGFHQNEREMHPGRAAAETIDLVRTGFFKTHQTVLFWHTGGQPALFAEQYAGEFKRKLRLGTGKE